MGVDMHPKYQTKTTIFGSEVNVLIGYSIKEKDDGTKKLDIEYAIVDPDCYLQIADDLEKQFDAENISNQTFESATERYV
jgi:hypothetical protein